MQKSAPFTVHYGRALQLAGQELPPPERVDLPTRHGAVRCEVYRPPGIDLPAAYLHLHGGAFIMRHPRMDDFFARYVVDRAGVAVVTVDYATAPQARYPVAHEQVHDVAAHLAEHGPELGLDGSRPGVGGFSAGGNLAASTCLRARDAGATWPRFALLGVPSLDVAEGYAEKRPLGRPMLGPGILELVRATYFPDPERRAEPYASPARATDLSGLPPTMVVTAELDLLRREGDAFARRLAEAGVEVDHHVVPGVDHYFLDPEANARTELERMARTLQERLTR